MFFFRNKKCLSDEEKKFSEEQVFIAAKQRIADVFHLSLECLELDDVFGKGKLHVAPPSFFGGQNELDILNQDTFDTSWDGLCTTVIKKM